MPDTLIVGAGLAGTTLARKLEAAGITFHIVHSAEMPSASRKAAGVWNPVVVKRFMKTWLADETIREARRFYPSEEKDFNRTFFFTTGMLKLLSNVEEKRQFLERREELEPYIRQETEKKLPAGLEKFHEAVEVSEAGYLDVSAYLDACRKHFMEAGVWIENRFLHSELISEQDSWSWQGQLYRRVVFCEGAAAAENPWMKDIPVRGNKGQVLELAIDGFRSTKIINKQIFILPRSGRFRVGSTYEWRYTGTEPDEQGREELLGKLNEILPGKKVEVHCQEAGVRPTTPDRRPVMGALGEPGLFAYNGLGSRGVLQAPYLSACMLAFLKGDRDAIPEEARLQRFV